MVRDELHVHCISLLCEMKRRERQHVIYADGKTDDTSALQAWLEGEPAWFADGEQVESVIRDRTFRINGTLYLEGDVPRVFERCVFEGRSNRLPMCDGKRMENKYIYFCHFRRLPNRASR